MILHQVTIDMVPGGPKPEIWLNQYDSDFTIRFDLVARRGEFTAPTGTTAAIRGTKPDGNGFSADAVISGSTVTVTGDQQMTVVAGKAYYELTLYKSGKELNTANFILNVERAALDMDTPTSRSQTRELVALEERADEIIAAVEHVSDAEAYAIGTRDGEPVPSTDPAYNNSAKYWAEHASGENLAPQFSTSTAYAVGDYVLYNNHLYRFTSAHAAGAWNAAHATAVTTMAEVTDLKGDLSELVGGEAVAIDGYDERNTAQSYLGVSPFVLINGDFKDSSWFVKKIKLNVMTSGTLTIGVIKKSNAIVGESGNASNVTVKETLTATQTGVKEFTLQNKISVNEDEYLTIGLPTDTIKFAYGDYGTKGFLAIAQATSKWTNVNNSIGMSIDIVKYNPIDNAVRFDISQDKTDAEKTQARKNAGIEEYHEMEAFYHPDYSGFIFTDEDGNILGALSDPSDSHNPLSGKKLSILGDSISTYSGYIPSGYATYYPRGDVDDVEKTWWRKLIAMSGMTILKNASWSGSRVSGDTSTTTGAVGCSDARINELKNDTILPDIIICYISTNDWGGGVDVGSFDSTDEIPSDTVISNISDAYALMLYKLRNAYPNADIYCITSLEGRQTNGDTSYPIINSKGETIHQVNHAISEIAHIFGAKIIDLQTCGIHYWNVSNYTVDGTLHPNNAGTTIIAKTIYTALMNDCKYRG